jgi:hypothetical protein
MTFAVAKPISALVRAVASIGRAVELLLLIVWLFGWNHEALELLSGQLHKIVSPRQLNRSEFTGGSIP